MTSTVFVWSVLVIIGVFDAREHRIPNLLVLSILFLTTLELLANYPLIMFFEILKVNIINFLTCFSISLIIYAFGGMAAGDVKLIAAIGFIIGQGSLVDYLQYTSWACVVIGGMYWMLNNLINGNRSKRNLNQSNSLKYSVLNFDLGGHSLRKSDVCIVTDKTYMPFAPILIIGLAMYQFSLR